MHALLPLSADPVTLGHLSLIRQARGRFDRVTVAILDNDAKRGRQLFSIGERLALLEREIGRLGLDGIRAIAAPGILLADLFLREGCDAIVRGIRSDAEREEERAQARLHALILPGIDERFVYLLADDALRGVSSSMAKALVSHGLDASALVPVAVKEALEERILGRRTVAVTGPIASGKSFVCARLAAILPTLGVPCVHLSYDALLRDLYVEQTPGAERMRAGIAAILGDDVRSADGTLNRAGMAATLFHPNCPMETRRAVESLTAPHVFRLERERLAGFRGLVLLECATLVEMGLARRANNRAVVVDAPERASMLAERHVDADRAAVIARHQSTVDETVAALERRIAADGHGSVIRHVNRRRDADEATNRDVLALARTILSQFPAPQSKETK